MRFLQTAVSSIFCCFLSALFFSCSMVSSGDGDDDGGSNSSQVITGTITVPDSSYWTNLKIGLFSDETYSSLGNSDGNTTGVMDYRFYYDDANDGSDVSLESVSGTGYTISGTGSTSRAYSFVLPATVPADGIFYYLAAWVDSDANSNLDLKDAYPSLDVSTVIQGEFNRCAYKNQTDVDISTSLQVDGFAQNKDLFSGTLLGTYKYRGFDSEGTTQYVDLNSNNTSGFNFHMVPDSGW